MIEEYAPRAQSEVFALANRVFGEGYFRSMSTIGTKLLRGMHDALVGEGADKLIVTFKRGASTSNVDKVMSKLGFELWATLPSFWAQRCDQGAFKCVDRDDHCRCEALSFTKAVF